jgi:PleD family two-component response regulator
MKKIPALIQRRRSNAVHTVDMRRIAGALLAVGSRGVALNAIATPERPLILVVEDNDTNLRLITYLLTTQGYEVHGAADAGQAMKELQTCRPTSSSWICNCR